MLKVENMKMSVASSEAKLTKTLKRAFHAKERSQKYLAVQAFGSIELPDNPDRLTPCYNWRSQEEDIYSNHNEEINPLTCERSKNLAVLVEHVGKRNSMHLYPGSDKFELLSSNEKAAQDTARPSRLQI